MAVADRDWKGWSIASRVILIILAVAVMVTFRDYGISNDEEVQHDYGKLLWQLYLSGFTDLRALSFIDVYRYGGLFDMVAVALTQISPLPVYETRHLLAGFCGIAGVAGCGKLGELLGGRRTGFMAAALLALTASYYGSMFNNTKDIPFAAAMVWTLYLGARLMAELPKPGWRTTLAYGAAFGAGFGIRVGVMMMAAYLAVGILLWCWEEIVRRPISDVATDLGHIILRLLPGGVLAYVIMAMFWPWGVVDLLNPLRALAFFSRHPIVIESKIFGELISSPVPHWYYIPGYLLVKLPEPVLALIPVGLVVLIGRLKTLGVEARQAAMVLLGALLPLVLFIMARPTVFNGMRHFFFVVPPLTAIAALGANTLWEAAERRSPRASSLTGTALLLCGLWQGAFLIALHPYQSVYYNLIAGGLSGAAGRFEMDYWANSLREAGRGLVAYIAKETGGRPPARPYTVAVCTEKYMFREQIPSQWAVPIEEWLDADFFIAPTQMDCDRLLDGEVIMTIKRLGAVIAVVKDMRKVTNRRLNL
jgi:hypothetical protein